MLKVGSKNWFNENDEKVLQTAFDFPFAVVGENNRAVLSPFQEMVLINTNAFKAKFDNK